MKLENLKCFLAVARTGSLHKAAEELFLTPQNLSLIIKNIEQDVGDELFIRTPRGMTLSEEGEQFYPYAQKIADTYEEYFNLKKSSGGILNLYTTPSLADDLAEVQGGMLSASYYLSVQKHSVHDLISKIKENHPGIYLMVCRAGELQELKGKEYKIIHTIKESFTVCHKSNLRAINNFKRANHLVLTRDYYGDGYHHYLRMSDVQQVKNLLRQGEAVYDCVDYHYGRDFRDAEEWAIVQHTKVPEYMITLFFNGAYTEKTKQELYKQLQKVYTY